jgi:hypothetical protein
MEPVEVDSAGAADLAALMPVLPPSKELEGP